MAPDDQESRTCNQIAGEKPLQNAEGNASSTRDVFSVVLPVPVTRFLTTIGDYYISFIISNLVN